jgi:hypothetical protein
MFTGHWIQPNRRMETDSAQDVLFVQGALRIYFRSRQSHQEIIKNNQEFLTCGLNARGNPVCSWLGERLL